jgi:hypothetical protein
MKYIVALIIALSVAVACFWALLVPPLENPDEIAHIDYIYEMADVGHPFVIKHPHEELLVTPQAKYLLTISDFRKLRYNPYAKLRQVIWLHANNKIDQMAPMQGGVSLENGAAIPYVMKTYPIGYYTILAGCLALFHEFNPSFLAAFFFLRFVNVCFFAITLIFANELLKNVLRDPCSRALSLIAIGVFPLNVAISASIQPDNLTTLLISATLVCLLRYRKHATFSNAMSIAFALSALFFTKHQYALVLWAVCVCNAWSMRFVRERTAGQVVLTILPLIAFLASINITPAGSLVGISHLVRKTQDQQFSLLEKVVHEFAVLGNGVADVYIRGVEFSSFWMTFGLRGATYFPKPILTITALMLYATLIIVFGTFVSCQIQIAKKLTCLRPRDVTKRILSEPFLFTYIAMTVLLLLIYAMTDGALALQGRYWLPVCIPLFLAFLQRVRHVLTRPYRKSVLTIIVLCCACFSILSISVGSCSMINSYYGKDISPPYNALADVEKAYVNNVQTPSNVSIALKQKDALRLSGYAIDIRSGLPAYQVFVLLDDHLLSRTRVLENRNDISTVFHDARLSNSGFSVSISTDTITVGKHDLRFDVADQYGRTLVFSNDIFLTVSARNKKTLLVQKKA